MIGGWMPVTADLDHLLGLAIAGLALAYLSRATIGFVLWTMSGIPGRLGAICREGSRRVTPGLVRRLGCAALGALAAGTSIGSASSATPLGSPTALDRADMRTALDATVVDRGRPPPVSTHVPLDRGDARTRDPDPSPAKGSPSTRRRKMRAPGARPSPVRGDGRVTVRRGDCLWRIAAERLPRDARPAAVDREWRRWYRANRDEIGPDPDVLQVGTRLRMPT